MLESDHSALGASANRAGNVEDRTFAATPRDDECLKGLELLLALVDGVLEVPDAPFINTRLGQMVVHFVEIWRGQKGADAEKIALDRDEHFVDAGHGLDRARHAERRVQLVDIAVGFNPRVVLGNPAAAEEAGVAGVACLCVDLHRVECSRGSRRDPRKNGWTQKEPDKLKKNRIRDLSATDRRSELTIARPCDSGKRV